MNVIGLRRSLDAPRFGMKRATSAREHFERGCTLEATDPRGAISAYTRAVAGRPDLADAWNNLGRLHAGATAESCFRLAICADPSVAIYHFNLGVTVEDLGRHAEAIAHYEAALALDASLADAHYNLARVLDLTGARMAAIRHVHAYRRTRRG